MGIVFRSLTHEENATMIAISNVHKILKYFVFIFSKCINIKTQGFTPNIYVLGRGYILLSIPPKISGSRPVYLVIIKRFCTFA